MTSGAHRGAALSPEARAGLFAGLKAAVPMSVSSFPFGLAYGVGVTAAGIDPLVGASASWTVLAGAAQLTMLSLIENQASWAVVVAAGLVVNLRFALYSIALAPAFKAFPARWRFGLPYLMTDQTAALSLHYFTTHPNPDDRRWDEFAVGLGVCRRTGNRQPADGRRQTADGRRAETRDSRLRTRYYQRMRARSFSHVGITVRDFNTFVRFYWDVFGCPLVGVADTPPDRVRAFFGVDAPAPRCRIGWIRVPGGAVLEIFHFEPQQAPVAVPWNRVGQTHFSLNVRNTQRWHDYLVTKGVEIVSTPEKSPRGHTFFFARDCDGNLIELMDLGYMHHVLNWLGPLGGWLFRRGMYRQYYR